MYIYGGKKKFKMLLVFSLNFLEDIIFWKTEIIFVYNFVVPLTNNVYKRDLAAYEPVA